MQHDKEGKDMVDILDKLPKNTPTWAVGLGVLMFIAASSFGAIYVVTKGEIQKLIEVQSNKDTRSSDIESNTIGSILSMYKGQSEQITVLSGGIFEAQKQNNMLATRVTDLEKDLKTATIGLSECAVRLKKYEVK